MVANDVNAPGAGFDVDTNRVTLLRAGGEAEALPLLSKAEVALRESEERPTSATVQNRCGS